MARSFQILTDAVCDLPATWLKSHPEIIVVDTPVIATKRGCRGIIFKDLTPDTFDRADAYVKQGYTTRTSLPIIWETEDEEQRDIISVERLTRQFLEEGIDVVYLAMNSAISGTYGQVHVLYNELNERYAHSAMALCLDTECASTGLAMLIMDLIASEPKTLDDVREHVAVNQSKIAHVFTWLDFTYIVKSGKVNALSATIGKMLELRPLCSAEYLRGERPLIAISNKIRGTHKFVNILSKFVKATIDDERGVITVAHGNLPEKAEMIAGALSERLPKAQVLYGPDWRCGAAIQAHGGPTSIHVNYHRKPASFEETAKIFHEL
ncbi:DegV family EDD domain-containing protein [Candidatus Saccharibacteria bacterium]|nr:DegV family EDD domain-containing protein [Candidatus Saccharibacteria bacterium]